MLINNAGALFNKRQETADGLEMTFALNHMAYFVITNLLLPKLKPGARIVTTASDAHRGAKLDFDDLQSRRGYSRLSGLFQIQALQHPVQPRTGAAHCRHGVTANCLHPGFVATRFGDQSRRADAHGAEGGQADRRDLAGRGRQDHHLSGVVAGGGGRQRRIFL